MTPKTLRVRASGTALVQNHEKLEEGTNAFIGRKFAPLPDGAGAMGFVPTGVPEQVPYRPEYVLALKAGDLKPADRATADVAGVDLEPEPKSKDEDLKGGK